MSSLDQGKIEAVKEALKELKAGLPLEDVKRRLMATISPDEIPLIEQQLIKEGAALDDLLKLCDLHLALSKDRLAERKLEEVPEGHPLKLLVEENKLILKLNETLSLYLKTLASEGVKEELTAKTLEVAEKLYAALRLHYRKVQMLLFPYLERLGIYAVPRVLWGREHEAIVKLRKLRALLRELKGLEELVKLGEELFQSIPDIAFREDKILYPALWTLLDEGMWAAIHEEAHEIGWAVTVKEAWKPSSKPTYPWQVKGEIKPEILEKLPTEIKAVALSLQGGLKPDDYQLLRQDDINLDTGFLQPKEIVNLISSLPLELTFADSEGRIRFYSVSKLHKGFKRVKHLLGRKLEHCHPPQLERIASNVFNNLKRGVKDQYTFYTKAGDRTIRVITVAIRDQDGKFLGVLEIAEDITDILENPEKIKRKIQIF